jgi:methylenetetrahydrofolate reductase (NADPH)
MAERPSGDTLNGEPSPQTIRQSMLRLLDDYAVDTTPFEASEAEHLPEYLPLHRRIYVGQPPGTPVEAVIDLVERLHALGYRPIPQLAVRELDGEPRLRAVLSRCAALGLSEALIVAGDREQPAGPYASTLDALGTGLFAEHGITTVGIGGYPEGNRLIGPTALAAALADKADLAAACGWQMYVVTQLSFDPAAVLSWMDRTAAAGLRLPVRLGLPGLGSLRDLIGYARRCGVGASMRALVEQASSLAHPAHLSTSADLIVDYARRLAIEPRDAVIGTRFFTYSGLADTARWLEQLCAGQFELHAVAGRIELHT